MRRRTRLFLVIKQSWPYLVSAGSAMVMILAFFIPSVQDQWDRYQSRKVVQQYELLGDQFFQEEQYKMAEAAYARAYELSEEKRLDIEVKRLNAKINLINLDPDWGSKLPEDLEEVDFQFLLHMQKGKEQESQRISTMNSYGIFLAHSDRTDEAMKIFDDVIRLQPDEVSAHINLGNLFDQLGDAPAAEKSYRKAIEIDSGNIRAHYNLGVLFSEHGREREAVAEFEKAMKLDPGDSDAAREYKFLREGIH